MRITQEQYQQLKDKVANGSSSTHQVGHDVAKTSKNDKIVTKNAEKVTKSSKYKNVPTMVDGIRFASKKEAEYYEKLKLLQKDGVISFFIRQPSFDLPGGIKYRADFMVFGNLSLGLCSVSVVDCKGFSTDTFKLKHRLLQATYPFDLKII